MPIFEYRCRKCGRVFEQLVRSDAERVECPDCASRIVVKLLSAASTPRTAAATASFKTGGGGSCAGGGCGCSN